MAALNFPTSPSDGQVYENYVYNATLGAWLLAASAGGTVTTSGGFETNFLTMGA